MIRDKHYRIMTYVKILCLLLISFSLSAQTVDQYKTTTAGGSVNAYTIPNSDFGAYRTNEKWLIDFTGVTTNSGAATLNRNSYGAISIKMPDGTDPTSGILKGRVQLSYNGTYFYIVGGSGSSGSSTFTGLTDGPGSFSGKTLNFTRVNSGETALEYRTPSQVFSDIGFPTIGSSNTILGVNNTGDGLEYKTVSNGLTSAGGTLKLGGTIIQDINLDGHFNFVYGNTTPASTLSFNAGVSTTTSKSSILMNLNGFTTFTINSSGLSTAQMVSNVNGVSLNSYKSTGAASFQFDMLQSAMRITDFNTSKTGIQYAATGYVTQLHSLVDKEYADTKQTAGNYITALIGDVTASGPGSVSATVTQINGTSLAGLATGILKNTTSTGVPSIAIAGDFPTLNQNTTGSAATLTTTRNIALTGDAAWNVNFNGSADVTAALTLATVNSNVGTFGSATKSTTITVNGKGLITAISEQTLTPAVGSITGLASGIATWLATPSSANLSSAITDETGSGALVFASSPAFTGTPTYGTLGYSDTDIAFSFQKSVNSYFQIPIQNTSNGGTASTDIIISSDNGTATTHYLDLGKNSSGFTGSGSLNQPGYSYLTSTTDDLVIGTTTANAVRFIINSGTTDVMTISSGGNISITQPSQSSGWASALSITPGTQTALTTATEFKSNDFKGGTWTWVDGTVATQRFNHFEGWTINRTTTSATFSAAYNVFIEALTPGTGVTLTNSGYSLGLAGNLYLGAGTVNFNTSLTFGATAQSQSFTIQPGVTPANTIDFEMNGNYTAAGTSHNFISVLSSHGTAFASGTQSVTLINSTPTYNNSGGTTTIRLLDYNPTETTMTGTTHYFITNRSTTALSGFGTGTPTSAMVQINAAGSNAALKTVGVGTGTNKSLDSYQSDGTTNILFLKDNGDFQVGLSGSKWGMFGTAAVANQSVLGILVNNVTSGGSTSTIADFSSLTVYATDAATIRNNDYQLAKKVLAIETALRNYGILKD